MKRVLASAFAAALLATACGSGGQSATDVLSDTSANLGKIQSGDLAMELLFSTKAGERAGFTLEGPFELHPGGLPEAQFDYTQIAGDKTATQTFIAKGEKAYVRIKGITYELPDETSRSIRSSLGNTGNLGVIDLSNWLRDAELQDGGTVGGAETDRVTGGLNVAGVVSGLLAIASQFGGTTPLTPLTGASAEQVERAVESATIDVYTGKDDRLLRKLVISMSFAPKNVEKLKDLLGASVDFTLSISNPNEQVAVETPTDVQPYPAS